MDYLTLSAERYSVRKFRPDPVPEDVLRKILEAGRLAPTACNKQPQRIYAVSSEEGLERIRRCTACHFNAPLVLAVCVDTRECWKRSYDGKDSGDVDAAIVATHLMMEAADLGVGSTWVMYFIPEAVKEELSLPEGIEPVALLPMGYPAENCRPASEHGSRKPLEETVTFC